jgi:ammonia channel protein AmtB
MTNQSLEVITNPEILARLELLTSGLDSFFLAASGSVVLFMHAGFACLEAGSVRAKNTTNILMKNIANLCFGKLVVFSSGGSRVSGKIARGVHLFCILLNFY